MLQFTYLEELATAYFHQDYDDDHEDADSVIAAFCSGGHAAISGLIHDIDSILESSLSESEIDHLWAGTWYAEFDPASVGETYRTWLSHVRNLLLAHENMQE